ncbi:MAG: diadenylate cyclase CdaA [Muribaculaceae bacterium]|nr:diadenylate cyclase CdaA [Muribaculaceae bacterium]
MLDFGIKDVFDIVIVALLLYYTYRLMKESGTLNIFYGVMAFIVVWVIASEILDMRLTGTILDKFMSIGLLILVILFQDQIKRFLVQLGSHRDWRFLRRFFHHEGQNGLEAEAHRRVMAVVYACMSMSKSKTGALIVVQGTMPLESYAKTGDIIDARINTRLIENIFFKNSPLHDGAMIIANHRIEAAGCILPVSHDSDVPRSLGLRHRSALGIAQATDAIAIVVSEETGNISVAHRGKLDTRLTTTELEHRLTVLDSDVATEAI